MKILILANNDIGLYNFRKELIYEFLKAGHKVYISLPYGEKVKPLKDAGCIFLDTYVDRRGINPFKDFFLIINYFKIIKKIKPDKVISYTIKPNIYGGAVCRLLKTDFYANITGLGTAFQNAGLLNKFITVLYKFSFKKAKKVFFENCEDRDVLVKKGIAPKDRTVLLNGAGVNLEDYSFCDYPPDGRIRFLFIGRIMHEKGVDELFCAAKRLKEDGVDAEIDVVGPFEENYSDTVDNLVKDKVINFYGFCSDVRPFIEKTHCFVLPSYHEGMANTLLESGAMGRPLITSNIHGCLEAVDENVSGFLCKSEDAKDLYEKMKQFLNLPYDKKKEMGKKSHEYISANFDKRKVVRETVKEIMI